MIVVKPIIQVFGTKSVSKEIEEFAIGDGYSLIFRVSLLTWTHAILLFVVFCLSVREGQLVYASLFSLLLILVSLRMLAEISKFHHEPLVNSSMNYCVFAISNIVKIFGVLELEDFGPGYCLFTSDDEAIYVRGEPLAEVDGTQVDSNDHEEQSLAQVVYIKIDQYSRELIEVNLEGEKVEVCDYVCLSEIPVSLDHQLVIFSTSDFDPAGIYGSGT